MAIRTAPKRKAITKTHAVVTVPARAIAPSTIEVRAMATWVSWSRRRLGNRSAMSPAYGDSSSTGRNCSPVVMPSWVPPVPGRLSTSQSWATRCIQVPVFDTTLPARYSR